jgi:hypothetical protein
MNIDNNTIFFTYCDLVYPCIIVSVSPCMMYSQYLVLLTKRNLKN